MKNLREKEKMTRNQMKLIGLVASVIATVAIWAGFSMDGILADVLGVIWLIGLEAGYVLAGGIKGAVGFAWKLAKFGWLIVPFPMDIMTGVFSFVVAFLIFLLCPAFFVLLSIIKPEEKIV